MSHVLPGIFWPTRDSYVTVERGCRATSSIIYISTLHTDTVTVDWIICIPIDKLVILRGFNFVVLSKQQTFKRVSTANALSVLVEFLIKLRKMSPTNKLIFGKKHSIKDRNNDLFLKKAYEVVRIIKLLYKTKLLVKLSIKSRTYLSSLSHFLLFKEKSRRWIKNNYPFY